ncbi:hypothetical protein RDI58_016415 [Solanum bulbocastanum]|uniref:Golgi apparatus membrane protein TVP23 n=1 Tax=Solanum bulbocastanum TaxID=147425 RepID=A0AAN8TIU5_SOLBU
MVAAALAFYILSALFVDSFVIIFVITVLLAALDFWVVKNVSGRILVGLRWWNEIDDNGESVWRFECLDQESMARMNKKDSWLFWWTLYLTVSEDSITLAAYSNVQHNKLSTCIDSDFKDILAYGVELLFFLSVPYFAKFQADYLLVVGVCLTLSVANIVGFTRCRKGVYLLLTSIDSSSNSIFTIGVLLCLAAPVFKQEHKCMTMLRSSFKHLQPRLSLLGSPLRYSRHLVLFDQLIQNQLVVGGNWSSVSTSTNNHVLII